MKYFEVGQKVWCAIYGEGTVTEILDFGNVKVQFKNCEKIYLYDGRLGDYNITLSQNPIAEIVNTPLPEYDLSFAEAMEAVVNGKKVQFENSYRHLYFNSRSNLVLWDTSDISYISLEMIKAKWRIIED